jgi:hypothetical protein
METMTYCSIYGSVDVKANEQIGIISGKDVYAVALIFDGAAEVLFKHEVTPPADISDNYAKPGFVGTVSRSRLVTSEIGICTRIDFAPTKSNPSPEFWDQLTRVESQL